MIFAKHPLFFVFFAAVPVKNSPLRLSPGVVCPSFPRKTKDPPNLSPEWDGSEGLSALVLFPPRRFRSVRRGRLRLSGPGLSHPDRLPYFVTVTFTLVRTPLLATT